MTESKIVLSFSFALLAAMTAGCSGDEKKVEIESDVRELKGTVDTKAYRLDNAMIIAQSQNGHTVTAPVGLRGEFLIKLPVNTPYRVLLANSTRSGRYEVLSRVVWSQSGAASGIKTQSGGSGSGSGSSGSGSGGGSDSADSPEVENEAPESDAVCSESRAKADLPYDAKIPLGATYRLSDSFREKGALPAAILDVKGDGGDYRVAELLANTSFVVTQADCDHQGNKDTGRDRVFVTWKNADGSIETDHLDMRYCVGDVPPSAMAEGNASSSSPSSSTPCDNDDAHVCSGSSVVESKPSHDCEGLEPVDVKAEPELPSCPSGATGGAGSVGAPATAGAPGTSSTGGTGGGETGGSGSTDANGGAGAGTGTAAGTGTTGTGGAGAATGAGTGAAGSTGTIGAGGAGATNAIINRSIWVQFRPGARGDLGTLAPIVNGAGAFGSGSATTGTAQAGGAGAATGSADGVGVTGVGGASGASPAVGTTDLGGRCAVTADCRVGLSCVANKCAVPIK